MADGVAYHIGDIKGVAPWRHDSPAEALETLHTRSLWPFAAEGDGAVRWWAMGRCGMCGGRGGASGDCPWCNDRGMAVTSVPTAPTISALVAVASLGASALLRAASLAEDIARAAGHPKARIVWRVMTRAAIEDHHNRTGIAADAHDPATAFSREVAAEMYLGGRPAHVAAPWEAPLGNDATSVVLAWDALYALARHEDGTATGVHLVGIDAGAVTLACEALP